MSTARVRRPFVKRLALCAVPALLAASLAVVSSSSAVGAGGNIDAITVRVLGSPVGNITSSPLALSPTFAQTITDYVLRCHSGINTIQLTLSAASSGRVAVDKNRGSSVTIHENLVENQALIITGPGRGDSNGVLDQGQAGQGDSSEDWGHAQYWIRCLPHDFPQLGVTKPGNPSPGWYLTGNLNSARGSGTYAMVLDGSGTPVWYHKTAGAGAINLTSLPGNRLAWMSNAGPGFATDPDGGYQVFDLRTHLSELLRAPIGPTDFHELQLMSNGDLMLLSSPLVRGFDLSAAGGSASATVVDCLLEEMDPAGRLVWQWRATDHIFANELPSPQIGTLVQGQLVYDSYHCNSIDVDSNTGNVLMSSRHTDTVYFISKLTGTIAWKVGRNSPSHDGAQILTVVDDPEGAFHAQHDARFLPNNDISLYDNQTWDPTHAARGVEYHIDLAAGTATLVWSYQTPDGHNSAATGSFRRLDGGADNVIGWGVKPMTLFTEVDAHGALTMNVAFSNGEWAYRVIKVAAESLDHNLLRTSAGLSD